MGKKEVNMCVCSLLSLEKSKEKKGWLLGKMERMDGWIADR